MNPAVENIGRYRIVGELGRGAMGVVYKAQDPAIGRMIAIKSIRLGELTDESERERLRERLFREAQSAGILSHPGIVTIYDIAEEGGLAYIFMEFVNGPPLDKMLKARADARQRNAAQHSCARPPRRSITRTKKASSIATSSPPTSWCTRTAPPRSPTSASLKSSRSR